MNNALNFGFDDLSLRSIVGVTGERITGMPRHDLKNENPYKPC